MIGAKRHVIPKNRKDSTEKYIKTGIIVIFSYKNMANEMIIPSFVHKLCYIWESFLSIPKTSKAKISQYRYC